ncbi:glycoside hydrolase/deacetylase, partial [Jaminaea rosea]
THKKLAARQSKYPEILKIPDPSLLPSAWKDALKEAVDAGKIPDISPSTLDSNGNPSYPSKYSTKDIGSWTLSKYIDETDISQAPDGVWAIGFDDGPTDLSPPLYKFLEEQKQAATHFLIGSNIVSYPNEFMQANSSGGQLAVHTWSHKLQTASTNEQVLGDLAWTMQIIYDRTGRIPNLWRPPQGDVDNRVRAIATEVLGLRCVLWQADANDWCLDENFKSECPASNEIGQSYDSVVKYVNQHINGPQSPGLVILAHEIHTPSIQIFQHYYPRLKSHGWKTLAVGEFDNQGGFYANA